MRHDPRPAWQRLTTGTWWEDDRSRERHAIKLLGDAGRLHAEAEDNAWPEEEARR